MRPTHGFMHGLVNGLAVVFVVAAISLIPSDAPRADALSTALGCSGDPCVVKNSPGGELTSFQAAARQAKASGRRVVIDGPCYSACAIFADMARSRVCVTPRARFGFHQGYVVGQRLGSSSYYLMGRFKPTHSRDIARWVSKNGGYPKKGFRVMGVSSAGKIWRKC